MVFNLILLLGKNLIAAKPPEQSESFGGIKTLAVRTKSLLYMVLKGFPPMSSHRVISILYTDIIHHVTDDHAS